MKFLLIFVFALVGCSSLKYEDVKTMTDYQLCSAAGNASFNAQKARFDDIVDELTVRENAGTLSLSAKECKKVSDLRWQSQDDIQKLKQGLY